MTPEQLVADARLRAAEPNWLPSATRRGQLVDDFCRKHGCTALDVFTLVTRLEAEKREAAMADVERMAISTEV